MSKEIELKDNKFMGNLNDKANVVYRHVWLHTEYATIPRDYGTGQMVSEVEVHAVTAVDDNEGISITELAEASNRTKGAISQLVTKLEYRGFLERRKTNGNAKEVRLFLTESGKKLSRAHKKFDKKRVTYMLNELLKECTVEEINNFYKVIECRNKIVLRDLGGI